MSRRLIDVLLLVGVVLLVAVGLLLGAPHSSGGEGEKFGGTDSAVTEQLDAEGYTPWFHPLFEPGSSEVESGLFAVQAALGGGILGYCLGALRTRSKLRRDDEAHLDTAPAHDTAPDTAAASDGA